MSGTCHNWFTFESGFFNSMPLGATSPIAVWKGAVMQTSPHGTFKDLQCHQSSLANIGMSYLCICVNQHCIWSAPLSHLLSGFAVPRREQLKVMSFYLIGITYGLKNCLASNVGNSRYKLWWRCLLNAAGRSLEFIAIFIPLWQEKLIQDILKI